MQSTDSPRTTLSGYTKLFSSILMSSIWEEPAETRIVWVTLLALADQHGHIDGTVKSLARVARVPVKSCERAILTFISPDPNDRSGVEDGRRLRIEPGGWALVNYALYRQKMSAEERKERDKLRKRAIRASAASPRVSESVREISQAEAEAEADQKDDQITLRARFDRFWQVYPRKVGKDAAWREWLKRSPSDDLTGEMITAVERDKASPQWRKDGGEFIPHPRTWLHQGRWQDGDPVTVTRSCKGGHTPPCTDWTSCTRKTLDEARAERESR